MTGKTHLTLAVVSALMLSVTHGQSISESIAAVTLAGIGGLLPDIDHKNSRISKQLVLTSAVARMGTTHRGFFHSPFFWSGIGAILWVVIPQYFKWVIPVLFGCATHLGLDMLNPTGIPLFWPLSKKKWHLAKIRTGGAAEKVIAGILTAISIAALVVTEANIF